MGRSFDFLAESRHDFAAVLFDLDNTLHDRDAAFRRWSESFARDTLGFAEGSDEFASLLVWLMAADCGGYGNKHALFRDLHRMYPRIREQSVDDSIESYHAALVIETRLDAETADLLAQLKAAGIPIGIVTNGSARQQRKVEHLNLHRFTDCVIISEIFGAKKPDISIFLTAADRLGIPPSKLSSILFVGDHPENDIVGAKCAGMQTAWVSRSLDWPSSLADSPPDITVRCVADLAPLLARSVPEENVYG